METFRTMRPGRVQPVFFRNVPFELQWLEKCLSLGNKNGVITAVNIIYQTPKQRESIVYFLFLNFILIIL